MTETKTIGIIQTGSIDGPLGEKHGQYPAMFEELLGSGPFTFRTYNALDGDIPTDPMACDGWVITGSRHGVYEQHDWIAPLEVFIRDLVASGQPTVGICFGHQIMATAMGGTVEKFGGGWGIGLQNYTVKENGETVRLLSFHQDQVMTPPAQTDVFLSSDFCPFAGLRYSPTCFSLQPHPEHSTAFMADLIEVRRPLVSDKVADQALAILDEPNDQARFGQMMIDVLDGDLTL
jgi:GMP synthase (glutamine-hydrolysing)